MTKEELIEKIKYLISSDNTKVDINPNYLNLFSKEELKSILDSLIKNKQNLQQDTNLWFDKLFGKIE